MTLGQRQGWTFDHNIAATDLRIARATEFAAMYLDRIEQHLERIAASVEKSGLNDIARQDLHSIAHMLPTLLKK